MKDHSQQLKAGKRYLFKSCYGDPVWSATVLEVAKAYIHVRYESGNSSWINRSDFIENCFSVRRIEVLQELNLAVTHAEKQLPTTSIGNRKNSQRLYSEPEVMEYERDLIKALSDPGAFIPRHIEHHPLQSFEETVPQWVARAREIVRRKHGFQGHSEFSGSPTSKTS
jgi:hypothetical protein